MRAARSSRLCNPHACPACPVRRPSETSSRDPGGGDSRVPYLLLVQFMKPLSRFLLIQWDLFQRKSPVWVRRLKAQWLTRGMASNRGAVAAWWGGLAGPTFSGRASLSRSKTTHTSKAFSRSAEQPAPGPRGGGGHGGRAGRCVLPQGTANTFHGEGGLTGSLMEQTTPPFPLRRVCTCELQQEFWSFLIVHSSQIIKTESVFH